MIEKKPFENYTLEEEKQYEKFETISMKLNKEERRQLEIDKQALQQDKDSTAIKQMWQIARFVLHDSEMGKISRVLYNNVRRNVRLGINEVEANLKANVKQNEE